MIVSIKNRESFHEANGDLPVLFLGSETFVCLSNKWTQKNTLSVNPSDAENTHTAWLYMYLTRARRAQLFRKIDFPLISYKNNLKRVYSCTKSIESKRETLKTAFKSHIKGNVNIFIFIFAKLLFKIMKIN